MAAALCDIMFSLPLQHANRANITLFLSRILLSRCLKLRVERTKNTRINVRIIIISYNVVKNMILLFQ